MTTNKPKMAPPDTPFPPEFIEYLRNQVTCTLQNWLHDHAPEQIQDLYRAEDWLDYVCINEQYAGDEITTTIDNVHNAIRLCTQLGCVWEGESVTLPRKPVV